MLVLTRKSNQSIMIGYDVVVTVLEVRGDQVRLGIKAPRSIDFVAALPRHETGKLYKRLLRDKYLEGTGRKI